MRLVLDNSVTMRWFFGDGKAQDLAYANTVLDAMNEAIAVVPAIWALEVANVIARAEAKSVITPERSRPFLEMLKRLNIEVDEDTSEHALSDTLRLARFHKLTAYDASYLELALRKHLPLATLDENLQKAATKSGVRKFA